jgi:hypothetical protein
MIIIYCIKYKLNQMATLKKIIQKHGRPQQQQNIEKVPEQDFTWIDEYNS